MVFQVKSIFFKLKTLGNTKCNTWKSKGISDQSLYFANGDITSKLIRPSHVVLGANDYFFQDSANVITNKNIVNVYITYKLTPKTINTDNVLKNCGELDTHLEGGIARNVIIIGVSMSISVHASNKTQDVLVLGKGLVERTTVYAEKMYSPNFSVENKIFVSSLHYNGDNSYLFVNGQRDNQFKANDSVISGANTRILTLGTLTKPYPSGANPVYRQKTLTTPRCTETFMIFL